MNGDHSAHVLSLLRWYVEAGVDEAIGEEPADRYRKDDPPALALSQPAAAGTRRTQENIAIPSRTPVSENVSQGPPQGISAPSDQTGPATGKRNSTANSEAAGAQSLAELRALLEAFEGCPLSRTATNLVFGDGSANAIAVLIGEAPGAEEDRQGVPFVGPSGRLLDRMLASIGLDRSTVFISNTVFWRPPGNRAPTSQEVAVCMPFVERIIELTAPRLLIALGGPAATALLGEKESVGRLRGRWFAFQTARMDHTVPAKALYHPAYLLRSPAQKRLVWRDLLSIKKKLSMV